LNTNTQAALNQNGFNTMADLMSVQESNLDRLPKHLKAWWRNPTVTPADQVCIPFLFLKKLKAMRYWVLAQRCLSVAAPTATGFTQGVLDDTLLCMQEVTNYKAVMVGSPETDQPHQGHGQVDKVLGDLHYLS
jgi:hypothetical protein